MDDCINHSQNLQLTSFLKEIHFKNSYCKVFENKTFNLHLAKWSLC